MAATARVATVNLVSAFIAFSYVRRLSRGRACWARQPGVGREICSLCCIATGTLLRRSHAPYAGTNGLIQLADYARTWLAARTLPTAGATRSCGSRTDTCRQTPPDFRSRNPATSRDPCPHQAAEIARGNG